MPEFYGSAAAYRDYWTARARPVDPDDEDADINAALLIATEWLDRRYGSLFGGLKIGGRDQVREWPRTGVIDIYGYAVPSNTVPREIEQATYEAAARELAAAGSLSVDYTPGKYKSAKVEGIAVEFASFSSAADAQSQFPTIDAILYSLLGATISGVTSALSGGVTRV